MQVFHDVISDCATLLVNMWHDQVYTVLTHEVLNFMQIFYDVIFCDTMLLYVNPLSTELHADASCFDSR